MEVAAAVGQSEFKAETRFDGLDNLRSTADIQTQDLTIDKFALGNARIQGQYKDRTVTLSEMKVQHPAGNAVVWGAQMSFDGNYDFKTKVTVKGMDIGKLFQSLNLHNIPVRASLQSELPSHEDILRGELRSHL